MFYKASSTLTKVINSALAVMFICMTALVCLQVFYRYVLNSPLVGSEEAARAMLLYIVMIGSAVAVGNRSHMTIDYFYERFPKPIQWASSVVYFVTVLFVALLFVIEGYDLAQRTMMMKTPALQLSRGLLAYAFPISGVLMCFYALDSIFKKHN